MNSIKGVPISPGIAIGKVFIKKTAVNEISFIKVHNKEDEKKRFHDARILAVEQVEKIYQEMLDVKGEKEASIFSAHIEMLNDIEFIRGVEKNLDELGCNCEWSVKTVRDTFVEAFESMDNEYMKERAMDIRDISDRIIRILQGNESGASLKVTEPVIIAAEELTPSDTAQMDPELVLGIINEKGGTTSHSAIIARNLGIPFVIYPQITSLVQDGQMLAFDGEKGLIELEVSKEVYRQYNRKLQDSLKRKVQLEKLRGTQSITKDGFKIILAGNIGSPEEADKVLQQDGHSIGLFRTEFLYMNRHNPPGEEEQFEVYRTTAEKMQGKPVIFRTLDIGGDKEVDYLQIQKEGNPFLGYRAIRLCLDRVSFWKVQLRAILRASSFGSVRIMFPMIASMDELMQAKNLLEEVKSELRKDGVDFNENIPVGMMMETPAAAIMADAFAREVDFFSIGTNDLTQYTMAVDRMNEKVSHLYSPYNPAVLRLIKRIVDCAHENGIWAGICGEAAADKVLLPLWTGMGMDELSMSPVSILEIREKVQGLQKLECEKLVNEMLLLKTAEDIKEALLAYVRNNRQ